MSLILKSIGATLLFIGCGFWGFSAGKTYLLDIKHIHNICSMISRMISELEYRQPPLPYLLQLAADTLPQPLSSILLDLSVQLRKQVSANVSDCMNSLLNVRKDIPPNTARCLQEFANHLGQYDLSGQIRELESLLIICKQRKTQLESESVMRVRCYRVFGLCAGALLAIILI